VGVDACHWPRSEGLRHQARHQAHERSCTRHKKNLSQTVFLSILRREGWLLADGCTGSQGRGRTACPASLEEHLMTYSLENKRVLIVGGGSDIAAALATDLLHEGAQVTLPGTSRRQPPRRRRSGRTSGPSPSTCPTRSRSGRPRIRPVPPAGSTTSSASPRSGPTGRSSRLSEARCSRPSTPRSSGRSCWPSTSPQ
jgi:hypothetical protein